MGHAEDRWCAAGRTIITGRGVRTTYPTGMTPSTGGVPQEKRMCPRGVKTTMIEVGGVIEEPPRVLTGVMVTGGATTIAAQVVPITEGQVLRSLVVGVKTHFQTEDPKLTLEDQTKVQAANFPIGPLAVFR